MKQKNESVERLDGGKDYIHIKDAIKEKTVVHCETRQEAKRILGMAHELGYKWWTGQNYKNDTEWNIYKSTMCYYLFDGSYSEYDFFKKNDYTIIPSTQIADFEEKKSTGWTTPPKDFEYKKIKEIKMKKYRLKKWYPSLDEKWDTTHRYEYQSSTGYMCNKSIHHCVIIYKKELHSDFWEEVEEPLFITEDGVEVSDKSKNVISIDAFFNKCTFPAQMFINENREHGQFKAFYHESNADEYILRNKRVFSYNDIEKFQSGGEGVFYDVKEIAKRRIEQ